MKKYLKDLETMYGTWEDFKKVIEEENPNLEQDFSQILIAIPPECIPDFLEWMINTGNISLVSKNIDAIMQCATKYKGNIKTWIDKMLILLADIKDSNIDECISNNLIQIIKGPYKRGNTWVIFELYKRCVDIGNSREVIEQNYGDIIDTVFSNDQFLSNNKEILSQIKALIYKVSEQEKIRLSDIEHVGNGKYSECLRIGNSILKFGKNRILQDLPIHKRILQPKLRINIPKDYKKQIELGKLKENDIIAIECQDLVDKDWFRELSDDEIEENLYMIYRDLRINGIIWTDIKAENVGRLLKTNTVKYIIKDSNNEDVTRQMSLPIGELVVFDTDRIYTKENLPKFNDAFCGKEHLYEKFENRFYREEEERISR